MGKYSIDETTLTGIAGAIRTKKGYSSLHTMTPAQMIEEINSISGGVDIGDDFFLLAENLGANANGILTSNLPSGGQIRLIDFDWGAVDLNTVKRFYDRLDSMYGVDENGAQESSCVNSISGRITIDKLSTYEYESELSTVSNRYPLVTIEYNELVENTEVVLNYYNDDGSVLLYSEVLAPGEDGTYTETPTKLNSPEFSYTFSGWSLSPGGSVNASALTAVGSDRDVYAVFTTTPMTYTVKFYNESTLLSTINNVAYNADANEIYSGEIPATASVYDSSDAHNYSFSSWVPEVVHGPTNIYAGYIFNGNMTRRYITGPPFGTIMSNAISIGANAFFERGNSSNYAYPSLYFSTALFPEAEYIGSEAFGTCRNLTRAIFPNATVVGEAAFRLDSRLTDIYFPELKTIGVSAFFSTRFSEAYFPKLTTIKNSAFANCSVTSLYAPMLETIGSYAFDRCSFLSVASFPLVTSLGNSAFSSCSRLTTVNLPNLKDTGVGAFTRCSSLKNVFIPQPTVIGSSTFYFCSGLEEVSFSAVTEVKAWAFTSCTSLKTINMPLLSSIGQSAFQSCYSITAASFPELTYLGFGAFASCSRLSTVSMPRLESIGSSAFQRCSVLTDIYFPKVREIGAYAFQSCSSLRYLSMDEQFHDSLICQLRVIGTGAFANCFNLSTVTFPIYIDIIISDSAFLNCSSLETVSMIGTSTIGSYAFANCSKLSTLTVSNSAQYATSVPNYVFSGCRLLTDQLFRTAYFIGDGAFNTCGLTNAVFQSAYEVGASAFANCSALSSLSFPWAVLIHEYAFSGCVSLPSIDLPAVAAVYTGAFMNCTSLSKASLPAVKSITNSVFYNCQALTSVYAPNLHTIGSGAFRSCSSLTQLSFPAATTIYASAFYGCTSLESLYLLGSSVCRYGSTKNNMYSAFISTPMVNSTYLGHYGSIFVPESLVGEYKNASDWLSLSARIAAYGEG